MKTSLSRIPSIAVFKKCSNLSLLVFRFIIGILFLIITHTAFAFEKDFQSPDPDTLLAHEYLEKAVQLKDSIRYDNSIIYYEKAAVIFEEAGVWNKWVEAYNGIGENYLSMSKYAKVLPILQNTLSTGLKYLEKDHPQLALCYNNLGGFNYYTNNYTQALIFFQKALDIDLKAYGKNDPHVGVSYINIGSSYGGLGNHEKQLSYLQDALEIFSQEYGEEHHKVAGVYDNIGYCYGLMGDYDQELSYYLKGLSIYQKVLKANHPDLANSYNNIGMNYGKRDDYKKQLGYLQKALEILISNFGEEHGRVGMAYNNIGFCYSKKGDHESELVFLKKGLDIFIKIFGETSQDVAISYNNIGNSYRATGDYDKAYAYMNKALSIQTQLTGEEHPYTGMFYNNLGGIYSAKGDHEKALPYYQKGYEISLKVKGAEHPNAAMALHNVGVEYAKIGDHDRALQHVEKALERMRKVFGEEHRWVANFNNSMGSSYLGKGNYDKAQSFFQKALNIKLKIMGKGHYDIANSYNLLADVEIGKKNWDKALEYSQQALITLSDDFDEVNIYKNPSLKNISSKEFLLNTLRNKASVLYRRWEKQEKQNSQENTDVQDLEFSLITYQLAIDLIDTIRLSITTKEAKQVWTKNSISIFEKAIQAAYDLYQETGKNEFQDQAFKISEKSKAFILLQALKAAGSKKFTGVPDSLVDIERVLKIDLAFFENKLFQAKLKKDTVQVQRYEDYLFKSRNEYDHLIKKLESQYPKYYQLKYNTGVVAIEGAQAQLLKPDQTLMEYFVGDSSIFVFLIRQDDYKVYDIKRDFPLNDLVNQMRRAMYYYQMSGLNEESVYLAYSDTFAMASHLLYQKLVAPFESMLSPRLVIVPDGVLNYIPFEALLKNAPEKNQDFGSHPYMLKDHQISYNYSATLLKEMTVKNKNASEFLLAFAPSFKQTDQLIISVESRRGDLTPLEYNIPEVDQIGDLLGGDIFKGKNATEENFIRLAGDYQILHLATHGKANDKVGDYSFLAFTEIDDSLENERLYVRDLYNLHLNADLVVLSACETGIGELQKGEGVISLARGFSYAGAKSLLTTLWSVNDKKTSELMGLYYQNIKKGMKKDAAIHQAKLDYIDQHSNHDAHPFYWAGFVHLGNMEPIQTINPLAGILKYGLLGLGLLTIAFWFYRKQTT